MGKYIMGVFFLLIAILLVINLQTDTVPAVEDVGEKINEDIQNVYGEPTP